MKHLRRVLCMLLVAMLAALPAMADVALPADTAVIEAEAFLNDTSLTGVVTIPAEVTMIGEKAFYNCSKLTGVIFSETPVTIASQAFVGCTGLKGTTISLPAGSVVATDAFDAGVTVTIEGLAGYPAIVPEMIQAEHTTITIYDYWSGDGARNPDPTEEQQLRYDYHDWIEATYNVKVQQMQGGDWSTCAEEMINFVSAPDGSLRAYIIEPGKVGSLITYGVAAPWGNFDLSGAKWNQATVELCTKNGQHYGVSAGATEPRILVYFNKRILEEAGIDWNSIYDMQAAGTWTWSAFESMLKKTTLDTDNDGVIDIWGVSGCSDDMFVMAVLGNGGSFFDFDAKGNLQPTMDSTASMTALNWGKKIYDSYWMHTPENANWDWYKTAWKEGKFAFYVYQAYGGFNDHSEMRDMEDEWGAVAFPVASAGRRYMTTASENTTLIPNVYNAETVEKIAFFIDLWTNPTPGYDDSFHWIGNKYNYTDDRAVDETYALLRSPGHSVANKVVYLGTQNDVLGNTLLWSLKNRTPAELIRSNMHIWQAACDIINDN